MTFDFNIPVRVIGGRGCVLKNGAVFKSLGERSLIVTGKSSAKASGALEDVTDVLKREGIEYSIFNEVSSNPLLSTAKRAGVLAAELKADFITVIGGGSIIDCAKAASVFAVNNFSAADIFKGEYERALPIITVGTTAGTGSEVNQITVLTDDADGCKRSIRRDALFAKYCFADPAYTATMDKHQTVSTGLDALCHCLESWFNKKASEAVAAAASRGVELIFPRLCEIADGRFVPDDLHFREDIYNGSLWGGISISHAGTGFPHTLGYYFTEKGDVPHGIATAIFERAFLEYSVPQLEPGVKKRLIQCVGSEQRLFDVLDRLTANSFNVSGEFMEHINERVVPSSNFANALGNCTADIIKNIVREHFPKMGGASPVSGEWLFN